MVAYQLTHKHEYRDRNETIEADGLTLEVQGDWIVLSDSQGPRMVIPSCLGVIVTRIDPAQDDPS
jgi:hypothetical protein